MAGSAVQPLEIMLFEGAKLPNNQTLAIIMPVIDELTSKWHSDNERSLLSMSFRILPFLEILKLGLQSWRNCLSALGCHSRGLAEVVSALGHSRCEEAVDLLVSIISKERVASGLGDVWINAVATLDSIKAREILMSFIDPGSPEIPGARELGRDDVLSIAKSRNWPEIFSNQVENLRLCRANLDRDKRQVLASVIVRLGDDEALSESLNLLDDERSPELPYELGEAIEEHCRAPAYRSRFEYLHFASASGNRLARQAYRNDEIRH